MRKVFTTLLVCITLLFAGCIDRDFDLANTSGEITVGGQKLVVPLANIDAISLDDIIGDNELIKTNEDGIYQISFSSFGDDPTKYESLTIDGISVPNITDLSPTLDPLTFTFGTLPTSLLFSSIEKSIEADIPTQFNIMDIKPVSIDKVFDFAGVPSQLESQGIIDDTLLEVLGSLGSTIITAKSEESANFEATIEILEELDGVNWVEFGCEEHPYGTPFNMDIDLNGIADIVSSGEIKLRVEFPQGYYLRHADGTDFPEATHNILDTTIPLTAKQKETNLVVYLYKIDYSTEVFTKGMLYINDQISYSYDIALNVGKGSYNLESKPTVTFSAAPKYKDVEIRIKHFDAPVTEHAITHSFSGIPNSVSIDKVAFAQESKLTLMLKGLEWFVVQDCLTGENISPKIEIKLPQDMHFREHALLDASTNILLASIDELSQGVGLSLEYIDCKNSTDIKQENGQLLINTTISATIHMESLDGHTIHVASITPPENLNIVISIAESRLDIDIENSVITVGEDQNFDFDLDDNLPSINQTIDIPELISEIKSIEIGKLGSTTNEPVTMVFKLAQLESFPVEELDVNAAINIGKMLRPTKKMFDEGLIIKNESGDHLVIIKEAWKPQQASLEKTLEFEALENIPAINKGQLTVNQTFAVTGSVAIKSGEAINLSTSDEAKINVEFAIDDIEVRSFTGKLDLSVQPESMVVELGDLSELGVDVNSLNLNPTLNIKLKDNPTGVSFNADIVVKTYGADGEVLSTISVPTIPIAGSGASNIILSTPRNADKYSDEGITFIAVEGLAKLLSKGIPTKIAVDLIVASDKREEVSLDLKQAANGYNIEYQYEVILPLVFDGDIDLSYKTDITDLSDTFTELADNATSLKVGDVGLVAEFDTTIPLNIVLSAELINAEGTSDGIAARLVINDSVIKGYNKATDGEKRSSKIDLDFDLGEDGSFENLRNVEGIRLKLSIYDTGAATAALTKDQYISGKLKLRVRDGLTVDIFELLTNEEE